MLKTSTRALYIHHERNTHNSKPLNSKRARSIISQYEMVNNDNWSLANMYELISIKQLH